MGGVLCSIVVVIFKGLKLGVWNIGGNIGKVYGKF